MNATEPERHLTALELDLAELGRDDAVARASCEAHLARCALCAGRWAEKRDASLRFATVVFPRTATAVRERAAPWRRRWWLGGLAALPLVATAFVLLVLRPAPPPGRAETESLGTTGLHTKGAPALRVFALRAQATGGRAVLLHDGELVGRGDALRFVLEPAGQAYAIIASVDGAGQTSIYFPYRGEQSARVEGQPAREAPGSIVLDAAPGPERLFALFSDQPLAADVVRAALKEVVAGGALAIRQTTHLPIAATLQSTFLLEKGTSQ